MAVIFELQSLTYCCLSLFIYFLQVLLSDTVNSTILIINKLQQMRCSIGVTSRGYILVNAIILLSSTDKNTK